MATLLPSIIITLSLLPGSSERERSGGSFKISEKRSHFFMRSWTCCWKEMVCATDNNPWSISDYMQNLICMHTSIWTESSLVFFKQWMLVRSGSFLRHGSSGNMKESFIKVNWRILWRKMRLLSFDRIIDHLYVIFKKTKSEVDRKHFNRDPHPLKMVGNLVTWQHPYIYLFLGSLQVSGPSWVTIRASISLASASMKL